MMLLLLLMLLLGIRNSWTHGAGEEEQVCTASSNGEGSESCKAAAAGESFASSTIDAESGSSVTSSVNRHNDDDIDKNAQEMKEELPCTDDHELCEPWADRGECKINPRFMNVTCRLSCQICKNPK
jgi:ShK domain-like